jgi:GntR family transcriptional regulator
MEMDEKKINKSIPIPLYYQLKQILSEYIRGKNVGSNIPTEEELCRRYNISRPTVRQAISELVVEGYLHRKKGKGTYISQPKIHQNFMAILESFNAEMIQKGLTPGTKVLSTNMIRATTFVRQALNLRENGDVIHLERLRSVNGEPLVIVDTYLPPNKLDGILENNFEEESLYTIIEKNYGYIIEKATRTLEPRVAGEYEAKMLKIRKGDPIQYIETVTYLKNEVPIEFSIAKYRGELSRFSFELRKRKPQIFP